MSAELTPWFPAKVKPVRVGVYERELPVSKSTAFWYFNGEYWSYGGSCEPTEPHDRNHASHEQSLPWRGLAADPKVPA